ncbi:hypothetical protein KAU33_07355, partial [Candidatus Dependentiae bacterium]|nr:hypothetical protein [Candidatus Dependentiae bacterium]
DNVMRGINATPIKVPSFYKRWDKSIKALIENIELDIWTLKESTVESQMELNHKKIEFEQKLFLWYVYLVFHLQISDLKNDFTITESGFLLNGWIPVRNLNKLEESLKKYDDNATLVYKIMEYNSEHPEIETEVEIPISLTGNKVLKPFSGLVSNYGFPKYGDLNPLPLVLFTYIFMFGLMFGDIGHGGLILSAGLFFILNPFRALYKVKDFGWILIACGISSIIFGILFGSIFGKEDILHHIWFSPMEEINLLLAFGLIIGVTVISLGMILMIIQSFLKHKIEEAFFGEWGILSLSFYWIIGVVSVLIISGVWSLKGNLPIIIILFATPLVLLLFKEPISSLFSKKKDPGAEHKEKEGLFVSVINLFIFIIDIFSNSLSHLRLSAFALTHAAMSGAIFLIARALSSMVRSSFGQGVINWIIFILGTILIILLEGLIVGIQAMRLNYYEFFSKFFEGGGKEFKPVKLITKDVLNFKK